nr:peptidase E [Herbihabitans rhizosphaerae]
MGFNRAREPWKPSPIFRYAIELTGCRDLPRICFLSTGTGDRRSSISGFYSAFLGRQVDASHVELFDKPNISDVAGHLQSQDMIWVDRGSVANLLAVWKAHGLDQVLRDCWQSGVVIGGESAGSLCWFQGGTTDSFGEVRPLADGLGLLPFSNAVHYADRRELFHSSVRDGLLPGGYATDAGAGLHFEGSTFVRAISDRANSGAYKVTRTKDGLIEETKLPIERLR